MPATANTALIVIANLSEFGSSDVFIDDVALLSVGSTETPTPETTCFQDMKAKLQHCTGRYVSLVLSGYCNSIQGQISSVGEGSIVFISEEGTRVISICNIISVTSIILAYVTAGLSEVFVINTSSNTVIAGPIIAGRFPSGIAITPNGNTAYVANNIDSNVSIINTITNTNVGTIPTDFGPYEVAITPDGSRLYVTAFNNVIVINTITNTVIDTITLGDKPSGIAITPDGNRAYVTEIVNNNVFVISTITNTVIAPPISVGSNPQAIAITPDGNRAYVVNLDDDNISIIDTNTNTVINTFPAGDGPIDIAITPDGTRAYVTDVNNISVINTITNTVIDTITLPMNFQGYFIAFTPSCI
ncbi:hypothetical protein BC30090_2401 [Bacillus cereus]|uniref:YncE family protein n=1 Tax=Bacillus paranthracis TaxID=2026186 RepID=UPI003084E06D|nr:hypothetical protein BC30090_2401 [Bacillus cereus]